MAIFQCALVAAAALLPHAPARAATFWVATGGSDTAGDGSEADPWATIEHAVETVPDGSEVVVEPGTYSGRIRLDRAFAAGVVVRSLEPYRALLRHDSTVVTIYRGQGITLEGFDIAHSGPGAGGLVIQIQDLIGSPGPSDGGVSRITLRDNVLHDSWNNDVLKINNGAVDVVVEGNMFYNQSGSDEHIDINSVRDVVVRDNVFFNDFEGSGRVNGNDTSSFVVIKDSNGDFDEFTGARDITVERNVFLGWQGSTGSNFVLIGEDGNAFFEADGVTVVNNLMLGQSPETMRAAFGVKGGRNVDFLHNTVVGDLPSLAFAFRLNVEGANPPNQGIALRANVWSDPTGTMDDFSDTPFGETSSFTLTRNAYWNGGVAIPQNTGGDLVNLDDDAEAIVADPRLPPQAGLVLPRRRPARGDFADGSATIREAFVRLVTLYGRPPPESALAGAANPAHAPAVDILGRPRSPTAPWLGAVEADVIFADGFETGDVAAWSASVNDAPVR
ncbi:MAG: hypothetical protein AAGF23_01705 [Acidobacteriota bacterium]